MRRLLGGRAPHHVSCFSFPLCFYRPRTNRRILANTRPWMLHVASACTPCCLLLHVIACCWSCYAKFETGQTFEPAAPNISFVSWLPTHGLQTLMGCILPTMHCRSHYCWELLHPFAHHCHWRTQQLPTLLLAQQCLELLPQFARSFMFKNDKNSERNVTKDNF